MRRLNLTFALYTGLRNLLAYRHKGGSLWRMSSAVMGIALSLIPLNVVLVVTNGMIEGITERFVELGTNHLQVRVFHPFEEDQKDTVEELLESQEMIRWVRPFYHGNGLLYAQGQRNGVSVKALPPDIMETDRGFAEFLEIQDGKMDLFSPDAIMISAEIAAALKVGPGDEVKLLVSSNPTGRGVVIRPSTFTVAGIFSTGYYELDALTAYVSLETGERLFPGPGAFYYGIKVENPFAGIEKTAMAIQRDLPKGWYAYTWYELEKPMYETFKTTKFILLFIMLLILLVASVNISSSMIMLVLEKEQDIAILKSQGTPPATLAASFIVTGFFLGVFGTILGMAVGTFLAVNINGILSGLETIIGFFRGMNNEALEEGVHILDPSFYLEEIPVRIHFSELWLISVFSILCATFAAYIPSCRAGKLRPLEILQKH
ncbi:MAG: ABC transporter permease [Spirochaetales bacterium]|nr:ABC transporter permease [Spirochaetales bacterium]